MGKGPPARHTRVLAGLVISTALYWLPTNLNAQHYSFHEYGREDGLTNFVVYAINQDPTGFLWVGTDLGVFRYDGHRFKQYDLHSPTRHKSVYEVKLSPDGVIWAATDAGPARLLGDKLEPIPGGESYQFEGSIEFGTKGRLYASTQTGLVFADPGRSDGMRLRPYPGQMDQTKLLIGGLHTAPDGIFWFGCGKSLCRLEDGRITTIGADWGLPSDEWDSIITDGQGDLWIRSLTRMYVLRKGTRHFEPRYAGLPPVTTSGLAVGPMGRVLATTDSGLARDMGSYWQIVGRSNGLRANMVNCAFTDREGSVWIGFQSSGLMRWRGYRQWENYTEADGLSNYSIWAIRRDASGGLWIATDSGLDRAVFHETGRISRMQVWTRQQGLVGTQVHDLALAKDGSVWVSTNSPSGISHLDPNSGRVRNYWPPRQRGLLNASGNSLFMDSQQQLWVITSRGLFRTNPLPGGAAQDKVRFEPMVLPRGTPDETFGQVFEDRNGEIWVAGTQGLAKLEDGTWTRYSKKDGLLDNSVTYLTVSLDGSIWIAYETAPGVSRLRFDNNQLVKVENFSRPNGPASDQVTFLASDARGWIWCGTDSGVSMFDGVRWTHYDQGEGMIWDECNPRAFLASDDGSVWIGTTHGLSHFIAPDKLLPSAPPAVVFTSLRLGSTTFSYPWKVPHTEHSFSADFSGLSFVDPADIRFRYRMHGLGKKQDWVETDEWNVRYPVLPPGKYQLDVLARSAREVWSTQPASVSFEIFPPWWQTWWFYGLLVLGAVQGGRQLWSWRVARLLEQQQKLECLLDQSRQASRLKSEFLANMSHEIRTPMNGVLGMLDLVLDSKLEAEQRDYLETSRSSAESLLLLLNDILDVSRIEADRLELDPAPFSLTECLQDAVRSLAVRAREKGLTLPCHVEPGVPEALIGDAKRLRQILLNLVGNAIKFTNSGMVGIRVRQLPAESDICLEFSVSDTGVGIRADKLQVIFEAFRQADGSTTRKYGGSGLGLTISQHLVGLMGGRIWVESEFGKGSTFYFTCRFRPARREDLPNLEELTQTPASIDKARLDPAEPSPTNGDLYRLAERAQGKGEPPGPSGTGPTSPKASNAPRSLRILLAEDNMVNQKLAMRLLEKAGHKVLVASDGSTALQLLEQEPVDLILMDVQMPHLDGIAATAAIRAKEEETGAHIPIVAMTAHAMKGDRERCLKAGMDGYLTKPIRPASLLEVIESAITLTQRSSTPQMVSDGGGEATDGCGCVSANPPKQPCI
jgi:signal transduction histidine kinase/CheY-like chemotaxis protein/ligand-binding sensor domain-containing protein